MLALGVGVALCVMAGPAAGQTDTPAYPTFKWAADESLFSHADARDEGIDLVHWEEHLFPGPNRNWIYVTGWVTEMDGNDVVGTRFATFKYDAEFYDNGDPPEAEARAFFPASGGPGHVALSPGEEFKAVAMVIDDSADDVKVYVVGQAPRKDTGATSDLNYCVVKYDKDLVQEEVFYYDGPVSGDDIPVDIRWAGGKVIVTGTSPGNGTGKDIATLALNGGDLSLDGDAWPSSIWGGAGERRYNYTDGDDRAVQLGTPTIASFGDDTVIDVVVVGTSWGGSSTKDDYTTHRWGDVDGILVHDVRYDTALNDVATGITDDGSTLVFVTGYSEVPAESFGPTGPEIETDYATLGYTIPFIPELPVITHWEERWDYANGRDFPRDIEMYQYPSGPTFPGPTHIWVTGAGGVGGTDYDVATIRYVHVDEATIPLESWSAGWAAALTWQYPQTMTVVGDEPYIAGAIGHSSADRMLALKYERTFLSPPNPPYDEDWTKAYGGGGTYTGGVNHEARKVIHTPHGTFITGVSNVTGEGVQFTTWRYVE